MSVSNSLMKPFRRSVVVARAALRWPLAERSNLVLTLVALAILLGSSVWFFTAKDDRGKSARLTADAWYYHAYLPSLVFDQDLDFVDEYKVTKNWYRLGKTPTGRQANVFGIGPTIYQLPFFVAGHGLASLTEDRADGFSKTEVKFSLYASLLFSLGALFFGTRLLARRLGGRYGPLAVALVVAAGGPVIYYAIRQPGYAHPFATFWAAWLVDYWDSSFRPEDSSPRGQRHWVCMGLLIGAASLARPQLVLWSLLGGYAAVSDLLRARALGLERAAVFRIVRSWFIGAGCALLIVLPQLFAWNALYGSVVASPQGEGFMRWGESAWFETLMSSRNGLFPWAPIYALGFIGLLVGMRRHARICSALILGLLLQAYANGAAWDWWAGGSFGGRRFDSCYIGFAFGLGVLLLSPWQQQTHPGKRFPALRVASVGLAVFSALLAGANMNFASTQSAPTVRIYGGQSASSILRKSPSLFGATAGWASSVSNLPARLLFAWRNDVSIHAYDRVVGVHVLGELFPGLNSFRGKKREPVDLNPTHPRVTGLERTSGKNLSPSGRVRILVGLNRVGPVEVYLQLTGEPPTVHVNGEKLLVRPLDSPTGAYSVKVSRYERGSNRLDIQSSPGFILSRVELRTSVNAAGHTPR
ncbi:MAG: hypothetical protein GY811_03415 [Myxococcales bacterium]|nr:hypothetical protein [Myxococcales bacterium]